MANSTERIGISHVSEIAERNNWMFREQPINDVGIDAHMEFTKPSGEPKQLLALQIKSGESYFREKKGGCVIFRSINERQYNYWTMNSLPCILVLYNPSDNRCIWQKLTAQTIKRTNAGFFVEVPLNQVFTDDVSNKKLLSFTNLPEHIANYNFLLSQKKFMEILRDGGEIKLHSADWVNKTFGRGNPELIVNGGSGEKKYSYPLFFHTWEYSEAFRTLFPWADFEVDEDYYLYHDFKLWQRSEYYYDALHDCWVYGKSFKEFRKGLPPIRNISYSDEYEECLLRLSLNDFGKSFLKVDELVSRHQPFSAAKPEGEDEEEEGPLDPSQQE